jgi:tetratricopeptide (TPR) repeat protein
VLANVTFKMKERMALLPSWRQIAKALSVSYLCALAIAATTQNTDLLEARDRGDRASLDRLIQQAKQTAESNASSAGAQYRLALAYSYGAEIAMEQHDKKQAESLAEAGLDPAQKAISLEGSNAEYHRLRGALCGQVIPANPFVGALKYGQCARDEINKAIQLNGGLALAYVSRGVGNYYLPASMGGGPELAVQDFDKAISLDPKLADSYLWKGITLRKENRNAEARKALEQAVRLAPHRVWAKEQLQKTPAS